MLDYRLLLKFTGVLIIGFVLYHFWQLYGLVLAVGIGLALLP